MTTTNEKMDSTMKFLLPSPDFSKNNPKLPKSKPHFLTPSGMTLLPREKQPPAMYGPRGPTVPTKYLVTKNAIEEGEPKERHFCESCEMEFQSSDDYRRHRSQHEHCPVDGCKYRGHPAVMDKHVTELHATGIYERIKKISTPEEIAAWREERRRRYPTVANTQMQRLAQEQRQRRGERLEDKKSRFGRQEDRKRARNVEKPLEPRENSIKRSQQQQHKTRKEKRQQKKIEKPNEKKQQPSSSKSEEQKIILEEPIISGLRRFEGTSKLEDYQHERPEEKNVLFSLVGMYGSDEENDDDCDGGKQEGICKDSNDDHLIAFKEEKSNEKGQQFKTHNPINDSSTSLIDSNKSLMQDEKILSKENKINSEEKLQLPNEEKSTMPSSNLEHSCLEKNTSCNNIVQNIKNDESIEKNGGMEISHDSSDEAPEEVPIKRSIEMQLPAVDSNSAAINSEKDISTSKSNEQDNQRTNAHKKRKNSSLDHRKIKLRKQNTMLEKLLEPEIRHERNVLLQCVRFVCQNNFFGIGSKHKVETEDNKT